MMDVKVSKNKHICRWVGWENLIYEIESKAMHKDKEGEW